MMECLLIIGIAIIGLHLLEQKLNKMTKELEDDRRG